MSDELRPALRDALRMDPLVSFDDYEFVDKVRLLRAEVARLERQLAAAREALEEFKRHERHRLFETCPDDCTLEDAAKCKVTKECHTVDVARLRPSAALGEGGMNASPALFTPRCARCARCGAPLGGYAVCREGSAEQYCSESCAQEPTP